MSNTINHSISQPYWRTDSWQKNRVCDCPSIPDGYKNLDPNTSTYVDASIAPLIVALNEKGFTTRFCCSGLEEDHIMNDGHRSCEGYISFVNPDVPRKLMASFSDFSDLPCLYVSGDCIRMRRGYPNDMIRNAWEILTEKAQEWVQARRDLASFWQDLHDHPEHAEGV